MKKDAFYRILGIFLVGVILLLMIVGFAGCRTVDLTNTKQATDSTKGNVIRADSSGTKTEKQDYERIHTIEYRDTPIYIPGQPYPVYVPKTEIIREVGSREASETAQKSGSDSGWVNVIKLLEQKEKETKGVSFTVAVLLGILGLALILLVAIIIYFKKKK